MKITKEELQQIIREELEAVLDEGVFGPKIGRKLSPDKYHYDKKKPPKYKKAKDLEYKPSREIDIDDTNKKRKIDIDAINKKIADKFGGVYKKLKETEKQDS